MQISESIAFKKKVLIKDAEKQMELRSVVSDKQKLIAVLEKTYTKATSEKHFYKQLEQKGIKLYSRNNQIVGAKLIRKFRFKTLCYDKSILRELDKNLSKNSRLETLKRIREKQKQHSKDRKLTKT